MESCLLFVGGLYNRIVIDKLLKVSPVMKLSIKKGNLLIQSKDHKILVGDLIDQQMDQIDIAIGKEVKPREEYKGIVIDKPGEYEAHGIMVQAQPSKSSNLIDLVSIDVEGINIIFLRSDAKLPTKKMMDQLGVNHVLVIKGAQEASKIRDLVDEFTPQMLIPVSTNADELLGFSKKLGIALPGALKSLSVDYENFNKDEENQVLEIVLLE